MTLCLLSLGGCVSVEEARLYEQYLNPKFRLDLKALSEVQRSLPAETLAYGPYRVAANEIVSTLYPNSMNRRLTTNLPQSNCLWLGEAGAHGGDWVDLSWEIVGVLAESDHDSPAYVHPEGGRTGLCDFADPISRTPVYSWSVDDFEPIEVLVNGQPVTIYRTDDDQSLGVLILTDNSRDPEDKLYLSEPLQMVGGYFRQMTQPQVSYQRNRPESHGACDPEAFNLPAGETHVSHNVSDPSRSLYSCPSMGNSLSSCGMRCTYKPAEDIRLINRSIGERANPQHDYASPALLKVTSAGRTIARPMSRLDNSGLYRWQVGVSRAPGNPTLTRWDENFTPHIKIKRASVFYIDVNGNPNDVVRLNGDGLNVIDRGQTLLQCLSDTHGRFSVGDPSLSPHPCGTVQAINPAYKIESLSDLAGNPLQAPLSWEIQLPELAGDGFTDTPVYIEFELEPILAPAALSFDSGYTEFDPVAPGGKAQKVQRLTNVGWQPVLIDRVVISDNFEGGDSISDPAAFRHRLPYQAQWLPLNVGISQTKLDSGPGIRLYTLQTIDQPKAPSLANAVAPFMELVESDGSPTLLKPADLDGLTLNRFGEEITFDGAVGFYQDATINFVEQARDQLFDQQARFALARHVYRDRDLPFVLAPGESQDILLSFVPTSGGDKTARLEVSGKVIGSGEILQVAAPLIATALFSADPQTLPARVRLPGHRPNLSTGEVRTTFSQPLLLINNGQSDLSWSQASIRGSHRLYFRLEQLPGASQRIPPGASTGFSVVFEPPRCDAPMLMAPQDTRLEFVTNVGLVTTPLRADLSICLP